MAKQIADLQSQLKIEVPTASAHVPKQEPKLEHDNASGSTKEAAAPDAPRTSGDTKNSKETGSDPWWGKKDWGEDNKDGSWGHDDKWADQGNDNDSRFKWQEKDWAGLDSGSKSRQPDSKWQSENGWDAGKDKWPGWGVDKSDALDKEDVGRIPATKWAGKLAGKRPEEVLLMDVLFQGKENPLYKRVSSGSWVAVEYSKSLVEHNITKAVKMAYQQCKVDVDQVLESLGLSAAACTESRVAMDLLTSTITAFLKSKPFKKLKNRTDDAEDGPTPAPKRRTKQVAVDATPKCRLGRSASKAAEKAATKSKASGAKKTTVKKRATQK